MSSRTTVAIRNATLDQLAKLVAYVARLDNPEARLAGILQHGLDLNQPSARMMSALILAFQFGKIKTLSKPQDQVVSILALARLFGLEEPSPEDLAISLVFEDDRLVDIQGVTPDDPDVGE